MSLRNEGEEPDLGYRFIPARNQQSIGHPKLEINILCAPSEKHFDPKIIQIPVFMSVNSVHPHQIEQLKIYHPWAYRDEYRAAPGFVMMSDRKGKKVEAFMFGGTISIDSGENCTTCLIQSDAPIIEVARVKPVVMKFVEEVEILLAERRVVWAEDLSVFEERLEKISVSLLLAVCLTELEMKFDATQSKKVVADRQLLEIVEGERQYLRDAGRWPEKVPSITEIL